jgi:hypothetical protein
MKKYLLLALLIFLFSCSKEDEGVKTYPDPEGYYLVDIKTDWFDKSELQGMKAGILSYVDQVEWMDEQEFGEDFEIWLDNVQRTQISEIRTKIRVDLIIKKSTTFGADEVYNERIEFYYDMPENLDEIMLSGDKAKEFIEKSIKLSGTLNTFGLGLEVTTGLVLLNKLLDIFNSSENSNKYKAEALLTGNIIGEKIKMFFLEYEKN